MPGFLCLNPERQPALERAQFKPRAWIWESDPALIVTPVEQRLPHYEQARARMKRTFGPVLLRCTGGSAVALARGVVCLTLMERWTGTAPTIEEGYRRICAPLQIALGACGIETTVGPAEGSFCDGRYNVRVNGKKIAGTSQRRRIVHGGGVLLSHAVVLVTADPVELSGRVAEFYAAAGAPREVKGNASTSLRDCLRGRKTSSSDFRTALRTALRAPGIS